MAFLSEAFVWLDWLFGVLLLGFVNEILVSTYLGCLPLFKRRGGAGPKDALAYVGG